MLRKASRNSGSEVVKKLGLFESRSTAMSFQVLDATDLILAFISQLDLFCFVFSIKGKNENHSGRRALRSLRSN